MIYSFPFILFNFSIENRFTDSMVSQYRTNGTHNPLLDNRSKDGWKKIV